MDRSEALSEAHSAPLVAIPCARCDKPVLWRQDDAEAILKAGWGTACSVCRDEISARAVPICPRCGYPVGSCLPYEDCARSAQLDAEVARIHRELRESVDREQRIRIYGRA